MGNRLENGQSLPPLPGKDVEGNDVDISQMLGDGWGVVLIYRGDW